VNAEVIPATLRDKKIHVEVAMYKTAGGEDNARMSSMGMNVACASIYMSGVGDRKQWPYYFMEQGQAY
jgi:hypothetical protein